MIDMAGGDDGDVGVGCESRLVAVDHAFRVQEGVVVDEDHVGAARGVGSVVARRDTLVVAELDVLPADEWRQEGGTVGFVGVVVHKNELDLAKP